MIQWVVVKDAQAAAGAGALTRLPHSIPPPPPPPVVCAQGVTPVWRALDSRYDQCVGHCECLPGRDMPDEHITLHFSCLQNGIHKPGGYATEAALGQMMYDNALSCTRHYSWHVWYQQYFVPAFGRLPEPHWSGNPIPAYNETHDEYGEGASRCCGARAAAVAAAVGGGTSRRVCRRAADSAALVGPPRLSAPRPTRSARPSRQRLQDPPPPHLQSRPSAWRRSGEGWRSPGTEQSISDVECLHCLAVALPCPAA